MVYNKINKLLLFVCPFITFGTSLNAEENKERTRPNIIFILTDDLGYGDLGVFYQNERQNAKEADKPWMFTPRLDALADAGVTLMQHYSAAPVSAPSRASLLTGVSQGHANVRNNQFDKGLEDNHTLASVLQEAGYSTAAFGKWGIQGDDRLDENGNRWLAHPLNRGFDYYLGYIRHEDGHEHYPKEGVYRGAKEVWENRNEISDKLDKCYTTDLWTAGAKRWIIQHEESNKEDPFFIYLAYDTPHAVLELPTSPYPEGGGVDGGVQWLNEPGHMITTARGEVDTWMHPDYANAEYDHDSDPTTPAVPWQDVYKRYATSVRRIDDGVGDIIKLLEDLNIDSNTLVIFTSDNGPSVESYLPGINYKPDFFDSFGPFAGIKRDLLEGGVHVPTIASWPEHIPAQSSVNTPNTFHDWLPTFVEVAGLQPPVRTDGVSLVPSLTQKGEQRPSLIYSEYFFPGKTPSFKEFAPQHRGREMKEMQFIRLDDFIGVRYNIQNHTDSFEIYSASMDPGQTHNLAGMVKYGYLQQVMKDKVLQSRRPNNTAVRPYDEELVPSVSVTNVAPGIKWNFYEGRFPWIPDAAYLTSTDEGTTLNPNTHSLTSEKEGVTYYEGFINVPTDGEYTFFLNNDSKAFIRMHDAILIDADYGYSGGVEKQAKILLKAGHHPFKLYAMSQGESNLKLEWEGPGFTKELISNKAFFNAIK